MSLLDKTNLLITPNAVKAGKLYSVIPASGTGDCTVVRNTTATRINNLGFIEDVAANVPRLTYLTVGGNPFLLDEAQDTNTSNYSEDLTNSFYTKFEMSVSVVSESNPRNFLSSNKLIPTNVANQHFMQTNTNKKVLSVFAKANGYSTVILFFTVHNSHVIFNSSTGAILATSGSVTGKTEALANGYFRFSAITTLDTHTQSRIYVINGTTFNDRAIAGNGVDGINFFGHQTSDILTSYIPSLGAAATTRNADVITVAPPAGTVKITTTFSNNTTQVITSIPATFTVPEGLIKQVLMQNSL